MLRLLPMALFAALVFNLVSTRPNADAASLAPAPKASASFDSGMLHVDRYGSGSKTLIFIPGLASGTWTWYGQITKFSPAYTVYAITLPGFDGRAPSTESDLVAAFSCDFWSLLETQHIAKPVVIGHSLGGTLAIYLAETHPERLSGIVAVDGLPVFPTLVQSTPAQRTAFADKAAAQYASLSHDAALHYEQNYMAAVGTTDTSFAPVLAELTTKSDPGAVGAWLKADVSRDLRPGLSKITVPFMEVMPYASPSPYSEADTLAFYKAIVAGTRGQRSWQSPVAALCHARSAGDIQRGAHAVSGRGAIKRA